MVDHIQDGFSQKLQLDENLDKIFLKDFDLEQSEHFIKFVFIPYFKDIYNDLAAKSDKKEKGIGKIVFTEVSHRIGENIIVCKPARDTGREILQDPR